jgi:hypothetical protein
MAGFAIMFAVGAAVLMFVDFGHFVETINALNSK